MTTTLTRPRQITLLKDGLAVGCAANGVTAITGQRWELESALICALRDWHYSATFAQVKTHPQSDIGNILAMSAKDSAHGGWRWNVGWCSYSFKNGETIDGIAELISDTDISAEAWATFARRFVAKLGEQKVRRG